MVEQTPPSILERRRGLDRRRSKARAGIPAGELVVSTLPSALLVLDVDWTCVHVNRHAESLLDRDPEELLGRNLWEVYPEVVGSTFQRQCEAAVREQRAMRFREYFALVRHWFDVRACPIPEGGVAVYFEEIDGVRRVEEEIDASIRGLERELWAQRSETTLAAALAGGLQGPELWRIGCETAVQVAGAEVAWMCRVDGDHVRVLAASTTAPRLLPEAGEVYRLAADRDRVRAFETGEVTMIGGEGAGRAAISGLGFSSGCWVPLRRHGQGRDFLCLAGTRPIVRPTALGRVRDLLQHEHRQASVRSPRTAGEDAGQEASSGLWQRTLDSLTRHVAVLDGRGVIIAVNDAWTRYGEENADEGVAAPGTGPGADYLAVCSAAAAAGVAEAGAVADALRELLDGTRESYELEYPCHSPHEQRWFVMRATVVEEHGERHVLVQHENVTPYRRAQALALRQAQLLDEIDAAVICTDLDGIVTLWNGAAERLYGWTAEEAVGRAMTELASGPVDEGMIRSMLEALHEHGRWEGEKQVEDRFGRSFTCSMRNSLILDEDGSRLGIIGISLDTSERRAHEENLEASREYLRAITSSIADGLLALNEDGVVIYGNAAAAKLLRRPVESLAGVPVSTVLGREPRDVAAMVTGDALVRVDEDWFVSADGARFTVTWTASPLHGGPRGEGRVLVFRDITAEQHDEARRRKETERLRWAVRIRDAVRDERFELFAQPIVDLRTGEVCGSELLLRLHDEQGNLVCPDDFLPDVEEHGLMGLIDRWVVRRGLDLAAEGRPVHLNLSSQSIGDPGVLDDLEQSLVLSPVVAANLTVELTETALTDDWEAAIRFTERVRGLGIRLALDDFGTGYNSFANLKSIEVDEIKIDMQFVQDLLAAPASESVVKAVVSLAADLGLRTVAEGVEDAATLERLRDLGVDQAQGYHVGRPASLRP